jgi:hypothetical protein
MRIFETDFNSKSGGVVIWGPPLVIPTKVGIHLLFLDTGVRRYEGKLGHYPKSSIPSSKTIPEFTIVWQYNP